MRLVTFHEHGGDARFGVVSGAGIVDAAAAATAEPDVALADVTLLPPAPDPAKILAIGLNYAEHRGHPRAWASTTTRRCC
jgi:2-keto-4-pentenoate hydratase/2-oxohepta-3-ene-1,7-dioic acid hydratase in catechol pathway